MFTSNLSLGGGGLILLSLVSGAQSDSLFFLWVMMELNLVGFLLLSFSSCLSGEYLFKYFVIQSVGSAMLLAAILLMGLESHKFSSLLGLLALMLKTGAAPFHLWFVNLMSMSNWPILLVLSFPQKFLPLMGLWAFLQSFSLWSAMAVVGAVAGSLGCLSIKTLLGVSSVFSLGWVFLMCSSGWQWVMFLSIYTLGVVAFLLPFSMSSGSPFSKVSPLSDGLMGALALVGGLSMAGFPPTPGFYMKVQALFMGLSQPSWTGTLVILVSASVFFLNLYLSALIQYFLTSLKSWWGFGGMTSLLGGVSLMAALVAVYFILQVGVTHEKFWVSSTLDIIMWVEALKAV